MDRLYRQLRAAIAQGDHAAALMLAARIRAALQ